MDHEKRHQLKNLAAVITLNEVDFVLAGAIIFDQPMFQNQVGHYRTVKQFDNTWKVYDNQKPQPYGISKSEYVNIQLLLYVTAK